MVFTYSRLHIYSKSALTLADTTTTRKAPIKTLMLPRPVYRVSYLDEREELREGGMPVRHSRWVAHLADSEIVLFVLSCIGEDLQSQFEMLMDTEICDDESMTYSFATDDAVGHTGGYFVWLSINSNEDEYHKSPTYTVAPIRPFDLPLRVRRNWDGIHLTMDGLRASIMPTGLPFSRSVSCLDFDDGHGILLIGSDAGQFCLVNFANVLLPNETFHGELPSIQYADAKCVSMVLIVHLHCSPIL